MMVLCAGCEKPIFDRYLHHVIDKPWHAACVQCSDCKLPLNDKCFSRDGRLYCRTDFLKKYGTKCTGCNDVIQMTDLVRRARDKVFHIACFRCTTCQKQLDTGEELYIINGCRFFCKSDYLNVRNRASEYDSDDELEDDVPQMPDVDSLVSLHPAKGKAFDRAMDVNAAPASQLSSGSTERSLSSPESISSSQQNSKNAPTSGGGANSADENSGGATGNSLNGGNNSQQGGTKRRGPRTTIKAKQLETLKTAFATTPKPTRHIREQLAQETGLNMRVIQVWFQNRRSKERRMKQLRYGGFRPGSRRSRNIARDEVMMGGPGAIFTEQLRRHPDPYYNTPDFCYGMFQLGPDHHNESPVTMGIGPPPGAFMMPQHQDGAGAPLDGHAEAFLMDETAIRRPLTPDGSGDDGYRSHHGFGGPLLPSNVGSEPGMPAW